MLLLCQDETDKNNTKMYRCKDQRCAQIKKIVLIDQYSKHLVQYLFNLLDNNSKSPNDSSNRSATHKFSYFLVSYNFTNTNKSKLVV